MNSLNEISSTVVLLLIAFAVQADDTPEEKFIKSVVQANQNLRKAGFNFGKQLGPLLRDQSADIGALAGTFSELAKMLKKVNTDLKAVKVPDSKIAKDLWSAHQDFLKEQEKIINVNVAEILSVALNPRIDKAKKKEQIEKMLEAMNKKEQADSAELTKHLRAFISEHDIDINSLLD